MSSGISALPVPADSGMLEGLTNEQAPRKSKQMRLELIFRRLALFLRTDGEEAFPHVGGVLLMGGVCNHGYQWGVAIQWEWSVSMATSGVWSVSIVTVLLHKHPPVCADGQRVSLLEFRVRELQRGRAERGEKGVPPDLPHSRTAELQVPPSQVLGDYTRNPERLLHHTGHREG